MFLFKKKSKTRLGLDIGTSAIKLVELEQAEGRYKLKTYGIFPLTGYLNHLGEYLRIEPLKMPEPQLAEMIKKILREARTESREVCLSVPVYSSFSTLIDLPFMPAQEIAKAIPFEAKKYVPVPISEVILDWSVIKRVKSGVDRPSIDQTQTDILAGSAGQDKSNNQPEPEKKTDAQGIQILLVAVPKKTVTRYARVIQLTGLELKALEAETFSLARSLVGNDKSPIVIVDTGARSSNISIIDDGYIRVTHNLEVGGGELTRNLSQKMNISFEAAEEMKKTTGGQSGQLVGRESVISVLDIIAAEIKKIVNHYQIKYNRRIEKCILAGGGVMVAGLLDYFSSKLGLEISLGSPFARIAYPSTLEPAIKELGLSLAVAAGLAMRE